VVVVEVAVVEGVVGVVAMEAAGVVDTKMPLTKQQKKLVKEALKDGLWWPKLTRDPKVNHRVDQIVMKEAFPHDQKEWIPNWGHLTSDEQQTYYEEAALVQEGSWL